VYLDEVVEPMLNLLTAPKLSMQQHAVYGISGFCRTAREYFKLLARTGGDRRGQEGQVGTGRDRRGQEGTGRDRRGQEAKEKIFKFTMWA
jgi:hypothetical protein